MNAVTRPEKPDWLSGHLGFLKGLKSKNETQQLLILLAGKNERTPKEQKTFDALVKSERASEKAKEARLAVSFMLVSSKKEEAEAERKARTHRLVLNGLLFDYADISHLNRSELLGLLLAGSQTTPAQIKDLSVNGAAMLALKEPPKAASSPTTTTTTTTTQKVAQATPDIQTASVYLNVEMAEKDEAKILGARWDKDLKKWYAPAGIDVSLFKKWLPVL